MLFTSKSFKEGKSELVFFITPEIVDPHDNNQLDNFEKKTETTETSFDKEEIENKEKDIQEK